MTNVRLAGEKCELRAHSLQPVATVVDKLTKVAGPWVGDPEAKIVQATAGHTFSLFLTSTGQVYASGSSEFGQLGNGKTGERLVKAGKIAYDIEVPPRKLFRRLKARICTDKLS